LIATSMEVSPKKTLEPVHEPTGNGSKRKLVLAATDTIANSQDVHVPRTKYGHGMFGKYCSPVKTLTKDIEPPTASTAGKADRIIQVIGVPVPIEELLQHPTPGRCQDCNRSPCIVFDRNALQEVNLAVLAWNTKVNEGLVVGSRFFFSIKVGTVFSRLLGLKNKFSQPDCVQYWKSEHFPPTYLPEDYHDVSTRVTNREVQGQIEYEYRHDKSDDSDSEREDEGWEGTIPPVPKNVSANACYWCKLEPCIVKNEQTLEKERKVVEELIVLEKQGKRMHYLNYSHAVYGMYNFALGHNGERVLLPICVQYHVSDCYTNMGETRVKFRGYKHRV